MDRFWGELPIDTPMVSAEQRRLYARDGFVRLGDFLDRQSVDELRAALTEHLGDAKPSGPYGILKNNIWRELPMFASRIMEGRLAQLAGRLLGVPEVVLFQDNLISKLPGTSVGIQWHQDFAYWPLDVPRGTTFWIALDAADAENGCLHYIPGSHLEGEHRPTDFVGDGDATWGTDLPRFDWKSREHEAVACPLAPGELVAHDPLTWHMSPPNPAPRPRVGWSLTWISSAVTWRPDHAPHPFSLELDPQPGQPVRGERFPQFEV